MNNMVKMKKDNIVKEISDNLISDYEKLGWEIVKEPKIEKFGENKEK